jgi:Fe-S oxidoreductase/nitrate reductase gamma subunit
MWNVPEWAEITFYLLIPLVLIAFAAGVAWRVRKWFVGRAEPGAENLRRQFFRQLLSGLRPRRLVEWVRTALFQARLSSDGFSLVMHLAIFWGMLVLAIGTALATVDQDFTNLLFDAQVLRGDFYKLMKLALDVFGVVLILGLGMAAYRRYLVRPERLQASRRGVSLWDGFPFLTVLSLIAVLGFAIEGLRLAEGFHIDAQVAAAQGAEAKGRAIEELGLREWFHHVGKERQNAQLERIAGGGPVFPAARWSPVGYALAKVFQRLPTASIRLSHQVLWWLHGLTAFGLILAVPFTKAFHLISSPVNMLLRTPAPPGRLPVMAESGVRTVRDYTWQQLLQVEACTWCGKCQEACPGHATGLPLSPRNLVQAIDAQLLRTRFKGNGETPSLHGTAIKPEELWACCTCRSCEEVCPVFVQHPRLIIDLRRHLVDQGQVDEGLQEALMNFQRYGNSFGQSARKRPEWAKSLGFKLKDARKEEVDYLWFVGDYASYDQRAQEVTRTIAKVLHRLGVDAGLLFEKEQNAGNDVRRIGEEGLFSMLREKNSKELEGAKFRKLLTTDPHTYNTLKNEYQANGQTAGDESGPLAGKPVLHYTELLDELLRRGVLKVKNPLACTVTYHDPCYLGRFNGVYEPPRRVLRSLGARLVEMPRHGPNSFCCGAGGGRIWMKDAPGIEERPAENRIKEAIAQPGVECLVVACPKDLAMFQDAVKTVGAEGRLRVADLGELVYEAMEISTEVLEPTT